MRVDLILRGRAHREQRTRMGCYLLFEQRNGGISHDAVGERQAPTIEMRLQTGWIETMQTERVALENLVAWLTISRKDSIEALWI